MPDYPQDESPEDRQKELRDKLSRLESKLSKLSSRAMFSKLSDETEDIGSNLALLPSKIEGIRAKGYIFKKYLERKAEVLSSHWNELKPRLNEEMRRLGRDLKLEADVVSREISLNRSYLSSPTEIEAFIERTERKIDDLEDRTRSAEEKLRGMFDTLNTNIRETRKQLDRVEWMQKQLDEASFQLHVEENAIEAVEAEYLEDGKKGPKGILYLTDQRLLFEQKEKVVVERRLLIFTKKEKVQELLLDIPLNLVEEVIDKEAGFIFRKELLDLKLRSGAPVREATFKLKADSELWRGWIRRVITGEIEGEEIEVAREEEKKEGEKEEKPRVIKCPTCGAIVDKPILRGQVSVECDFCGATFRI